MTRAFVALPLPADIRDRLAVVQQMLPLARRVPPENFHITLAFLDAQPDHVLEALHDELSAIQSPPLSLTMSGLAVFEGDPPRLVHAVVDENSSLTRLHHAVNRAAAVAGIQLKRRRFRPHVTLSRERLRGPELASLTNALAQLSGFGTGRFDIGEMCLYRSVLGPKGARYDEMARYDLTGHG